MAPKYELIYFPLYGLGNMIRIILADQGVDYQFTPVNLGDDWQKLKSSTPLGKLPLLKIDGTIEVSQSLAIVRYFARELNLMGSSNLEAAMIDMYIDQCTDVRITYLRMIYTNYEAGKAPFIESIPSLLAPFDKLLANNQQNLLFSKVTAADYILFDVLLALDALSPGCLNTTPNVAAFFKNFGSRSQLRAFLDRPDVKEQKFTVSGHL